MVGCWLDIALVLFSVFMDRNGVEALKYAKKKPVLSHLDQTGLANKGLIKWDKGK